MTARLLALGLLALSSGAASSRAGSLAYAPGRAASIDTLRIRAALAAARHRSTSLAVGAVIPGYLSSRGLPPQAGRITVTDTGLVFRSTKGITTTIPLVGPVRERAGRRWRASTVSLAFMDDAGGSTAYVFRVDAGVFETLMPGPLLEIAAHPVWLDNVRATRWMPDPPLVDARDSFALRMKTRDVARTSYADSLYALFGQPRARIGLVGIRGQRAGRLGEYIAAYDSLALDPGRISSEAQLRHTLAHELGHRWQNRAPKQVATLWRGVPSIRDPRRYGYGDVSEHQAEAIAFAVDFLQTTALARGPGSLNLLNHYELLVPGTSTMVRYLALQPLYRGHPLRAALTTGRKALSSRQ